MPGAIRLVQHLKAHGIPIAVATGTRREKFKLKTMNLDELFGCFEGKVVCSDDGLFDKARGKPCPDIFLVAASKMLGREVGISESDEASSTEKSERSKGLVFEDATSGVEAAKRAGMNGAFNEFAYEAIAQAHLFGSYLGCGRGFTRGRRFYVLCGR